MKVRDAASPRTPVSPWLLYDTLDAGSDEDLFTEHTPAVSETGKGWEQITGAETWTVSGANDNLALPAAASGSSGAGIDVGTLFSYLRLRMFLPSGGNWHTVIGLGGNSDSSIAGVESVFWNTNVSRLTRNGVAVTGNLSWPYGDDAWHDMALRFDRNGKLTFWVDGAIWNEVSGLDMTGMGTYFHFLRGQDGLSTFLADDIRVLAV